MKLKLTNTSWLGVKVCAATLSCAVLFGGTQMSGEAVHADEFQGSCAYGQQNCQFDGLSLMWTGKTQIVEGKMWYVMKCIKGHIVLAPNTH